MNHQAEALAALGQVSPIPFVGGNRRPIILMEARTVEALQAEIQALEDDSRAIVAAADEAGEDVSDENAATIEANAEKVVKLKRQLAIRQAVAPAPSAGRKSTPEVNDKGRVPASPRETKSPAQNLGQFAIAIRQSQRGEIRAGTLEERIMNAATTYGNEGTGAEGGHAVPHEFRRDIWQKTMEDDNLLTRCSQLVTGSNNLTIPKDETTPWQTSGGILAYWENEAGTVTQSRPSLETTSLRLNKLMALVPITDELLEDAPGLDSWLRAKAPAKMRAKINTAVVDGTGVGQPLGILRAPSLISQTKEGTQPADSIWFRNIVKMWSRLYAPCRRNAVWLINQDVEPQLEQMAFDPAATSKTPVYLPPGGLSDSPYATLRSRPVVPVEACKTIGDEGDIILVDLTQYWALTKGNDVKTDVSMHLYFDQGMQAFRFTFRVTGTPGWGSTISPQNGSTTRSWAVSLAARA